MTTPTTTPTPPPGTAPARQTPEERRQRIADAIAGYLKRNAGKPARPRRPRWNGRTVR